MAINRTPVLKRCRSLDLDPLVLGYTKKSNRKLARSSRRISEYGLQLREKQRAKFIYGVLERQFHTLYDKANRMEGPTGENLMTLLELRLDNVIYRLGFAQSRRSARQQVSHGHVTVNGQRVDIPSYRVKEGDVIAIADKAKELLVFKSALVANEGIAVPAWLDRNLEKLSGTVVSIPTRDQIDLEIAEQLIVELYSK